MDEQSPRLAGLTLTEFSEGLASADPVPGGGSASAFAAAMAASLTVMVARLSIDRPRYADYRETIQRALDTAEHVRARMIELTDADAAAYGAYAAARRLPKDTEDQQSRREQASRTAAREASEVPLAVLRECAVLLQQIEAISGRSNVNAASDLEVGARLCAAGARGAAANVIVNLPQVGDERYAGVTKAEIGELMHTIERSTAQVVQRVAQGGLRGPESA